MISSPVPKPFPLLKLPSEIRNCIWRYVVVKDGHITFREYMIYTKSPATGLRSGDPAKIRLKDDEPRQTSLLAIAFTCRQLYHEVTPIYYGDNIFRPNWYPYTLRSSRMFQDFTDAIGPTNTNTITQINLRELFWFDVDDYLSLLPNLRRLHFDKSSGWQADSKMTAFAKKHKSLEIVYDGEIWGPEKWKLYIAAEGI